MRAANFSVKEKDEASLERLFAREIVMMPSFRFDVG